MGWFSGNHQCLVSGNEVQQTSSQTEFYSPLSFMHLHAVVGPWLLGHRCRICTSWLILVFSIDRVVWRRLSFAYLSRSLTSLYVTFLGRVWGRVGGAGFGGAAITFWGAASLDNKTLHISHIFPHLLAQKKLVWRWEKRHSCRERHEPSWSKNW